MINPSLRLVAEDLTFLMTWGGDITTPDIRRGSATLRRLLVEGAYGNAWRTAGLLKEPTIFAPDLHEAVTRQGLEHVAFAFTGARELRGVEISEGVFFKIGAAPSSTTESPNSDPDGMPLKQFGINAYVNAPCAYIDGRWVSRADVIKYIANVQGGVHLSQSKGKREAELSQKVKGVADRISFNDIDGLHWELVAIAQAVGQSEDASRYVRAYGG